MGEGVVARRCNQREHEAPSSDACRRIAWNRGNGKVHFRDSTFEWVRPEMARLLGRSGEGVLFGEREADSGYDRRDAGCTRPASCLRVGMFSNASCASLRVITVS